MLETAGFVAVGFDVPDASFHEERALARSPAGALGPDLGGERFDAAEAVRRLRSLGALAVGEALLCQQALAGIGNVLKSEVLFLGRVDPFARVCELADEQLERLSALARELVLRNGAQGASGVRRTTPASWRDQPLNVYGRAGRPCPRCGAAIAVRRHGAQARATYFCPACQR